jgi:hypothetical protein
MMNLVYLQFMYFGHTSCCYYILEDGGTTCGSGLIYSTDTSSLLSIAKLAKLYIHFLASSTNKLSSIPNGD